MYPPQEDSYMLLEQVKKYAKGKVLDMGTGSGIQAQGAAGKNEVESVLAADIDRKVISELKKTIGNPKIKFIISDLFSGIFEKYDTIIFNPPYLPREERDEKIKDKALFGGKEGYEILERFFSQVKRCLNDNGIILIVFSSFTKKEKVDEIIEKYGFKFEELDRKHIFFEDLLVYKIERR